MSFTKKKDLYEELPQQTESGLALTNDSLQPIPHPLFPPPRTQFLLRTDADEESQSEKFCRICLDDDDPETMIAPCLCKGGSKWVHRTCLNNWREMEKDRAFAQCTECEFYYRFVDKDQHKQFWRRMKFYLFMSRDFCLVAVAIQLVVTLCGGLTMLIDERNGSVLLDLLDGDRAGNCHTESVSAAARFLWCQHKLAVYYLYGLFIFLVLLGIFGSSVLCANGCKVPDLDYSEKDQKRSPLVQTSGEPGDNDRRSEFYRSRRHQQHATRSNCCSVGCCGSGRSRRHPYYGGYYYDPCVCPDGNCCCCLDCPSVGSSGGNDASAGIFFMILLVVLIVLAIVGFFVGLFLGVILGQRILQRHIFLIQKKHLVDEFQVQDLSPYDLTSSATTNMQGADAEMPAYRAPPLMPPPNLGADDASHLRKLGLLVDEA